MKQGFREKNGKKRKRSAENIQKDFYIKRLKEKVYDLDENTNPKKLYGIGKPLSAIEKETKTFITIVNSAINIKPCDPNLSYYLQKVYDAQTFENLDNIHWNRYIQNPAPFPDILKRLDNADTLEDLINLIGVKYPEFYRLCMQAIIIGRAHTVTKMMFKTNKKFYGSAKKLWNQKGKPRYDVCWEYAQNLSRTFAPFLKIYPGIMFAQYEDEKQTPVNFTTLYNMRTTIDILVNGIPKNKARNVQRDNFKKPNAQILTKLNSLKKCK